MGGFFQLWFFGRHDWLLYQRFFVFCNVFVAVQVTVVCVLSVFIAPLLTVGLLPTTIARAARAPVEKV